MVPKSLPNRAPHAFANSEIKIHCGRYRHVVRTSGEGTNRHVFKLEFIEDLDDDFRLSFSAHASP